MLGEIKIYDDLDNEYMIYNDVNEMYYMMARELVQIYDDDCQQFAISMSYVNVMYEIIMNELEKYSNDGFIIINCNDHTGFTIVLKNGNGYKYIGYALTDNETYEILGYNTIGNLTSNDINNMFDNNFDVRNLF